MLKKKKECLQYNNKMTDKPGEKKAKGDISQNIYKWPVSTGDVQYHCQKNAMCPNTNLSG